MSSNHGKCDLYDVVKCLNVMYGYGVKSLNTDNKWNCKNRKDYHQVSVDGVDCRERLFGKHVVKYYNGEG